MYANIIASLNYIQLLNENRKWNGLQLITYTVATCGMLNLVKRFLALLLSSAYLFLIVLAINFA